MSSPKIRADELMKCALALRGVEIEAYRTLLGMGKSCVADVAERLGKSRPTAQRLLQDLVSKGLATRTEDLIGRGGYIYQYEVVPPERVKQQMVGILNEWHRKMQRFLEDFPSEIRKRT